MSVPCEFIGGRWDGHREEVPEEAVALGDYTFVEPRLVVRRRGSFLQRLLGRLRGSPPVEVETYMGFTEYRFTKVWVESGRPVWARAEFVGHPNGGRTPCHSRQ